MSRDFQTSKIGPNIHIQQKVLVNKFKNTGPMKISDVKIRLERSNLNQLRDKLRSFHAKGEKDMTIKYVNGAPKIDRAPAPAARS